MSGRREKSQLLVSGLPRKITSLVEGESDRGAILILTAYVEELLSDVIRASCNSVTTANRLLELRGPAGDFDSKIKVCIAFGLIHENEERALDAMRKIRNNAAHFDQKGRGFDVLFDSDQTVDQVINIAGAMNLVLDSREPEDVKNLFIVSARLLATKLMIRAIFAKPPQAIPTIKEIADEYRRRAAGTEAGECLKQIEDEIMSGNFQAIASAFNSIAARVKSHVDESGSE